VGRTASFRARNPVTTVAIELVLVVRHYEAVRGRHSTLQLLDQRLLELGDVTTLLANEVVVVSVFVRNLVAGDAITKMEFVRDAALGEHPHRPIHRGIADPMVDRPHSLEQLVDGEMITRLEERRDNQPTLFGRAQPLARHVVVEVLPQAVQISFTHLDLCATSAATRTAWSSAFDVAGQTFTKSAGSIQP
jgi:hypothetical protein